EGLRGGRTSGRGWPQATTDRAEHRSARSRSKARRLGRRAIPAKRRNLTPREMRSIWRGSAAGAQPVRQLAQGDHRDEDEADGEHDEDGLLALFGGGLHCEQV